MLALGQGALGTRHGRLRWIEADLATPGRVESMGEVSVDAALSTTALHWLPAPHLVGLYRELSALVRPGGVFLNGDHMDFGPDLPTVQRLAQDARDRNWPDVSFAARGVETAEQWWEALGREPAMARLLAERTQRFASKERPASSPTFDLHAGALRDAGFREVGTASDLVVVWRREHAEALSKLAALDHGLDAKVDSRRYVGARAVIPKLARCFVKQVVAGRAVESARNEYHAALDFRS